MTKEEIQKVIDEYDKKKENPEGLNMTLFYENVARELEYNIDYYASLDIENERELVKCVKEEIEEENYQLKYYFSDNWDDE